VLGDGPGDVTINALTAGQLRVDDLDQAEIEKLGHARARGVQALLIIGLTGIGLSLAGCAGSLPSQFANLNPPLSATDTKIVEGLATFDTPAAQLTIETGSGTITSVAMYTLISNPTTMDNDGLLLYGAGQEMQALPAGNVGSLTAVDDILTGVKANASTTQSVNNYATIAQGIDGLLGAAKTYVTNAASSATNPSVASYGLVVFGDDESGGKRNR
jgi:hypothetical protein